MFSQQESWMSDYPFNQLNQESIHRSDEISEVIGQKDYKQLLQSPYLPVFQPKGPDINVPCSNMLFQQGTVNSSGFGGKKGRVSNNGFKTPLSLFKKAVLAHYTSMKQQSTPYASSRLAQTKTISRKNNLTIFPKLVSLCEQDGILKDIKNDWFQSMSEFLDKKRHKIQNHIYEQVIRWTEKMEKALEADDWKEGIKIYWGENVRHKDKMERCMKEIEKLRDLFEY